MPKKHKGKKKDDDWDDSEVEKKLEEKMKDLATDDKEEKMEEAAEGTKSKGKKASKLLNFTEFGPDRVAQTVTRQATDACLTADPGVVSRSRPCTILSWRLIMK